MPGENENYTLVKFPKDTVVNECLRCGVLVGHRSIHEGWHAMNDKFETTVAESFRKLIAKMKIFNIFMKETNGKSNQKQSHQPED